VVPGTAAERDLVVGFRSRAPRDRSALTGDVERARTQISHQAAFGRGARARSGSNFVAGLGWWGEHTEIRV
ncbi:hypothetical protein K2X89_15070, partial [Myxococcota bacterium]|nr:hypothetical protein [Myxococcota bacterium]